MKFFQLYCEVQLIAIDLEGRETEYLVRSRNVLWPFVKCSWRYVSNIPFSTSSFTVMSIVVEHCMFKDIESAKEAFKAVLKKKQKRLAIKETINKAKVIESGKVARNG